MRLLTAVALCALGSTAGADFAVVVHRLDPRMVALTEHPFKTGLGDQAVDVVGSARLEGEAAVAMRDALRTLLKVESFEPRCEHRPGFGIEFYEGEGRTFATSVCFECDTWIRDGARMRLTGTDDARAAMLEKLEALVAMPAVFEAFEPGRLDPTKTVAQLEAWRVLPRREAKTVPLEREDGGTVVLRVPPAAYVNEEGWVSVFPGETVHVEFDLAEGQYLNPHYVPEIAQPERTMTLTCSQDKQLTMLVRKHGIVGKNVGYRLLVQYLGANEWQEVAVWALKADFSSFDSFDPKACAFLIGEIEVSDRSKEEMYEDLVEGLGKGLDRAPGVLVEF